MADTHAFFPGLVHPSTVQRSRFASANPLWRRFASASVAPAPPPAPPPPATLPSTDADVAAAAADEADTLLPLMWLLLLAGMVLAIVVRLFAVSGAVTRWRFTTCPWVASWFDLVALLLSEGSVLLLLLLLLASPRLRLVRAIGAGRAGDTCFCTCFCLRGRRPRC